MSDAQQTVTDDGRTAGRCRQRRPGASTLCEAPPAVVLVPTPVGCCPSAAQGLGRGLSAACADALPIPARTARHDRAGRGMMGVWPSDMWRRNVGSTLQPSAYRLLADYTTHHPRI